MIVLLIGLIIGFIIGFIKEGFLAGILFGVAGILISTIPLLFICDILTTTCPTESYVLNKQPIYALQDSNIAEGSFFLGCGNIDGKMEYVYLEKDEYGYNMKSVDANSISINESEDNKAFIATYALKFKSKFLNNNFFTMGGRRVINVPKGSIKYNFNVDLK